MRRSRANLLFIFTDEQRQDTMRCYGNELIRTPNLDRLASQSFVFDRAYVTQPVCTPSRSSLMTGLYPHTSGCTANNVPLPAETPTIAEMLPEDYVCGYIGKWHLGDELAAQHGFTHWVSIEDIYEAHYSEASRRIGASDYSRFLTQNGFGPDRCVEGIGVFSRSRAAKMPEEFTKAAFVGMEAARFIKEHREEPFLLVVNFLEPHMPFTGPFDNLYDPESIPLGPAFLRKPGEDASLYHRLLAEIYGSASFGGEDLSERRGWLNLRARYLGLITLVDRAVGRILQTLEDSGAADRTIVVFTSDHGDMMGDHGILAKCVLYEEAVRVPLLIRVPWRAIAARRIHAPFSQIDLIPTLLELMDVDIPSHLQGKSRMNEIMGDDQVGDDVFIESNGDDGLSALSISRDRERLARLAEPIRGAPWRTVITADGWKLNISPADRCELHNLASDPFELRNLASEPEYAERIRCLKERIVKWQSATGDKIPLGG